jgi:hypothetical protein
MGDSISTIAPTKNTRLILLLIIKHTIKVLGGKDYLREEANVSSPMEVTTRETLRKEMLRIVKASLF